KVTFEPERGWYLLENPLEGLPVAEKVTVNEPNSADKGTDGRDNSGGGSGNEEARGGGNNRDRHNGDENGCTGDCGRGGQDDGNGTGDGEGGCKDKACPGSGSDCRTDCPGGGDKPGGECKHGCGPTTTRPNPP